ncbi:MAG: RIP metalloprotease RseP [Thermodesulfobacteriota bacterium]|nr:RIP metalloprotease RseP [Thermodesulfobacteriota bacterium]
MISIIALIIVLGILIFIHEFGHFLMARLFGVGVERFSLGFGPRLTGFKAGITDYRLSAIPLGGYVKMIGEEPGEELSEADKPLAFTEKSVLRRFVIVAAGPVFNLILAVFIFYCLFQVYGESVPRPVIGEMMESSAAAEAGLKQGDRILAINDSPVETWTAMAERIKQSEGATLHLIVKRDGRPVAVDVTPRATETKNLFGEPVRRYMLGISPSGKPGDILHKDLSPPAAFGKSVYQTYEIIRLTFVGVGKMISGSVSVRENVGGPIWIAQMAGEQARHGATSLLAFIAFISISLAIINILPIPVLDGGHLLFFVIEAIQGKPVSLKTREVAQQMGLFVLVFLMVLVIYNDILRFFE